ncbi:MAG: hypothetical protein HY898_10280 [Deltaproteobacteria bacterium]|nr:hypothetical protein [Deltaproteobacteria bacterium]
MLAEDAQQASPSCKGILKILLVFCSIELAWMLALRAFVLLWPALAGRNDTRFYETYDRVANAGWGLLAVVSFVLTLVLARTLGRHRAAGMAWVAVVMAGINVGFGLVFAASSLWNLDAVAALFSGPLRVPLFLITVAAPLVFDVLFWLVLAALAGRELSRALTIAYLSLRSVSTLFTLLHVLPFETYRALFLEPPWVAETIAWTRFAVAVACGVTMLLGLRAAVRADGASTSALSQPAPERAQPGPQRDLVVGAAWLVGGGVATLASYSLASGGGKFVITTGAIAYGVARIVRGVIRMGR